MPSEYVSEEGGGSDPAPREKSRQAGREGNPFIGKMLPKSLATSSRGCQLQTESYMHFLTGLKQLISAKLQPEESISENKKLT